MSDSKIVAAVDIGTSNVLVLIGEIVDGRFLNIIGKGSCSSQGVRKGEILDYRAASNCAHAAIEEAERAAGVRIDVAYLSQTGRHLKGRFNVGSAQVSSQDHTVTQGDVDRAIQDAQSKRLPDGSLYIHHIQNPFVLDGRKVDNPLGFSGDRLEVGYWSVYGDERIIGANIHVVNGYGATVEDMIISGISSGCVVTQENERKSGVLVVDIGSGTTDYVLYRGGYVVKTGVIPVGGDHFTNDLCMGLRIDRKHAENFKTKFGKAFIDPQDSKENVWLVGDLTIGDRSIKKKSIFQILNARTDELFTLLRNELGDLVNPQDVAAGVVLTGGASKLVGIERVATAQLGLGAHCGSLPQWVSHDLREPENSTALGLLHYALTGHMKKVHQTKKGGGLFKKVAGMLSM